MTCRASPWVRRSRFRSPFGCRFFSTQHHPTTLRQRFQTATPVQTGATSYFRDRYWPCICQFMTFPKRMDRSRCRHERRWWLFRRLGRHGPSEQRLSDRARRVRAFSGWAADRFRHRGEPDLSSARSAGSRSRSRFDPGTPDTGAPDGTEAVHPDPRTHGRCSCSFVPNCWFTCCRSCDPICEGRLQSRTVQRRICLANASERWTLEDVRARRPSAYRPVSCRKADPHVRDGSLCDESPKRDFQRGPHPSRLTGTARAGSSGPFPTPRSS